MLRLCLEVHKGISLISIDWSTPYVKSVVRTNATVRVPPNLNSAPVEGRREYYVIVINTRTKSIPIPPNLLFGGSCERFPISPQTVHDWCAQFPFTDISDIEQGLRGWLSNHDQWALESDSHMLCMIMILSGKFCDCPQSRPSLVKNEFDDGIQEAQLFYGVCFLPDFKGMNDDHTSRQPQYRWFKRIQNESHVSVFPGISMQFKLSFF